MAKFRSLCVAGVIALSGAMATAMQAQTVSRNFNSQPLKSVLHEIERQTKMSVIVNDYQPKQTRYCQIQQNSSA